MTFDPIAYTTLRERRDTATATAERAQSEIVLMISRAVASGAVMREVIGVDGTEYFLADGQEANAISVDHAEEIKGLLYCSVEVAGGRSWKYRKQSKESISPSLEELMAELEAELDTTHMDKRGPYTGALCQYDPAAHKMAPVKHGPYGGFPGLPKEQAPIIGETVLGVTIIPPFSGPYANFESKTVYLKQVRPPEPSNPANPNTGGPSA